MLLKVDLGNSRIKWRCDNGCGEALVDRLAEVVGSWIAYEVEMIFVSSVASKKYRELFVRSCENQLSISPIFAEVRQGLNGLSLSYSDVSKFGVDRWLAMLAVYSVESKDFVVLDAGTAITVDFVRDGRHLGGWIVPGVAFQKRFSENLFEQSPNFAVNLSDCTPGQSTIECVESGIGAMLSGVIESVIKFSEVWLRSPEVYITGGDSMLFCGSGSKFKFRDNLVLDGLSVIAPRK